MCVITFHFLWFVMVLPITTKIFAHKPKKRFPTYLVYSGYWEPLLAVTAAAARLSHVVKKTILSVDRLHIHQDQKINTELSPEQAR